MEPFKPVDALLNAYATNNRINVFLIRNLPDPAWRAKPHGARGRDIASIAAHMHNVRLMWLKSAGKADAGKAEKIPAKLEGDSFTKEEAIHALETSWQALQRVLQNAFTTDGRIKGFKPDAGSFLAYLLAHDAHHRGQMSMLARQVGHPLPQSVMYGLWEWGTR